MDESERVPAESRPAGEEPLDYQVEQSATSARDEEDATNAATTAFARILADLALRRSRH